MQRGGDSSVIAGKAEADACEPEDGGPHAESEGAVVVETSIEQEAWK